MPTPSIHQSLGNTCAIVGSQWGDEGKGKLIDILSQEFDIIVRSAGGANAGHTIHAEGKKIIFHLVPSGILHAEKVGIIRNGCVVHLPTFWEEIQEIQNFGVDPKERLFLSNRAHLLFDFHKEIDGIQEERKGKDSVGTTKRGIGPAYADRVSRIGIRAGELVTDFEAFTKKLRNLIKSHQEAYGFEEDVDREIKRYRDIAKKMQNMIIDTAAYLHAAQKEGKRMLIEGAQGTLLDLDFGTYPYVTSSNTTVAGMCTGSGIAPSKIESVIGVIKAYTTRVGGGPFPSEDDGADGKKMQEVGREYGSTTGRPRRCGWFDVPVARHSVLINGVDSWNITKLDVLSGFEKIKILEKYMYREKELEGFPADLKVLENVESEYLEMPGWEEDISECRKFEELPENAQKYIEKLEELTETPVKFIGVGVDREAMIVR